MYIAPFILAESHFIRPWIAYTTDRKYSFKSPGHPLTHTIPRKDVKRIPWAFLSLPLYSHHWESRSSQFNNIYWILSFCGLGAKWRTVGNWHEYNQLAKWKWHARFLWKVLGPALYLNWLTWKSVVLASFLLLSIKQREKWLWHLEEKQVEKS